MTVHLPAVLPGFWFWLVAHWPAAQHGCRWEFGHAAHQASHWVRTCNPASPRFYRWPLLVYPAGR